MLFVRAQKLFRKKKSKKFPPTLKWVGTSFFKRKQSYIFPRYVVVENGWNSVQSRVKAYL